LKFELPREIGRIDLYFFGTGLYYGQIMGGLRVEQLVQGSIGSDIAL